jgi:hypothetical protein
LIVVKKSILGMLAAGTVAAMLLFLIDVVRKFAVADWVSSGQPDAPALAATFAVVLIAVGGTDLARFFVRAATRS